MFLEAWYSNKEENSINEHVEFPRVYLNLKNLTKNFLIIVNAAIFFYIMPDYNHGIFNRIISLNGPDVLKRARVFEQDSRVIAKFKDHLHLNHRLNEHNVLTQSPQVTHHELPHDNQATFASFAGCFVKTARNTRRDNLPHSGLHCQKQNAMRNATKTI